MASLPCQFCGQETGLFSGRSSMFRCSACGTVLCDNCVKKQFSLFRSAVSLTCLILTPTLIVPIIFVFFVGFRSSACLKCGGGVKSIS